MEQPIDTKLIDIGNEPIVSLLDLLLKDKSTKKNIIWATDTYAKFGKSFTDKEQIKKATLLQHSDIIKPRIQKAEVEQQERTKKKAEVFTPSWLCNKMNNYLDEDWFGRKDVFNIENEDHTWTVVEDPIQFSEERTWKQYVDSRRLEITCGEAPYLVSRYDTSTGDLIVPPLQRIGLLDRKLRIVNENAPNHDEWLKWAERAVQSCYGYEYQGDNLLLARINILLTYVEYYQDRFSNDPDKKTLLKIANIIAWNIWQMDGLKGTIPFGSLAHEYRQMTIFDMMEEQPDKDEEIPCRIYDWRANRSIPYISLKKNRERE